MTTSILSYIPAAKFADLYGRRPFIMLTFTFFALFPLMLVLTPNTTLLPLAFIVVGLREIGESARKALIVDLAEKSHKGRSIGLYYSIREGIVVSAPITRSSSMESFTSSNVPYSICHRSSRSLNLHPCKKLRNNHISIQHQLL